MDRDRLDQVRIAMMVINAAKEKPETVTEVMALVDMFGNGGFTGLIVLVMLAGFFVKK